MNRQVALVKLKGLARQLDALAIQYQKANRFPVAWVWHLFERFYALRDELQKTEPDLFGDLFLRGFPKIDAEGEDEDHHFVSRSDFSFLRSDIDYCVTVLEGAPSSENVLVTVEKEGMFVNSQVFDAFQRIAKIIGSAKESIKIIDAYVSTNLLDMLTMKIDGVAVQLLTKENSASKAFKAASEAFNSQYPSLEVRLSDSFHDRFVIIDDADYYHFGASLKDAGKRGSMFSVLEEPSVIEALRSSFDSQWLIGTPLS